ncbi:MAG: ScpA family protein [Candidatus Methanoperedens sp.]|nr:ScpA family protein [Candidatus Methanoperedens sp.]
MTKGEAETVTTEKVLEEPIEILVNLARNGEIDPWNIDIVDITDRFLKLVEEMEKMDLRISGRTLLYAAVLLRMKSNALVEVDEIPEELMDEGDNFEISDYPVPTLPLRRTSRRPVTLDELLAELKKAEAVEERRLERIRSKKEVHRTTIKEVMAIAHEEDIESRVVKMRNLLTGFFENRKYVQFSELAAPLDRAGRIMAYLALLYLATKKEIWLEQEEIFGELFIRRQEAS